MSTKFERVEVFDELTAELVAERLSRHIPVDTYLREHEFNFHPEVVGSSPRSLGLAPTPGAVTTEAPEGSLDPQRGN
ncbi:MAG: hypothetical protein WAM97_08305 [Acidimicrobiales bacterium]